MKKYYIALLIFALSGCAQSTHKIPAQYVSPLQYEGYSCKKLQGEMQSVSRRMAEVGGQVDQTASGDNAQMAIGMVLFWPALFFLDGDTPQAAEYGRLKGEFQALESAAIQKDCGFKIEPLPEKKAVPAKSEQRD